MKLYTVRACRWGSIETHSYMVGVFSSKLKAKRAARAEEKWRGGKYECEILEVDLDESYNRDKGYFKVIKPSDARTNDLYQFMSERKTLDLNIIEFLDGSAYLSHIERVRKARGAEMPDSFKTDPLMYQATCSKFLDSYHNIHSWPEEYGLDFEAEIGVVTKRISMGCTKEQAEKGIVGICLINDISLRGLIPDELKKGFGFLHGKPDSAMSVIVPIQEIKDAGLWRDGRFYGNVVIEYNGDIFGDINAGDNMWFSFIDLIIHATKTRPLRPYSLIGSGTVSSINETSGFGCIIEQRAMNPSSPEPFMCAGSRLKMYVPGFEDRLYIDQMVL